jgi:hypothetical protein
MQARYKKSLLVACLFGLLLPYFWIVIASEGTILDQNLVDHELIAELNEIELKEYISQRTRPMKINENLHASLIIALDIWPVYLAISTAIAFIIFFVNLFIWPKGKNRP